MSNTKLGHCVVFIAYLGLAIPWALAQRQPASVERRNMWDDPALRERFYNRAVDRYLQEMSQAYDLTEEQRGIVTDRLAALKQAQIDYAEKGKDEMAGLREQMSELWRKRQAGEPIDEKQMEKVSHRMREMWQASPLMNPEKVRVEVEKLLPPDQAGKGRSKWEEARKQRVQEWTERFSRMGGSRGPGGSAGPEGGAGFGGPGGRGMMRNRDDADHVDSWQRFVETFCNEFNLDDTQRASALSVLRDLQARRDQYFTSHADDFEAAQQSEDFRLRIQRMALLTQPVDGMFAELKTRLDKIPTTRQIDAVRARAATQPAETSGQGVTTATRPTDMIHRPTPAFQRGGNLDRRPASQPQGQ